MKYSIPYISRMHRTACMHFSTNLQSSKTIHWMDSLMDSYLKCLPFLIWSNGVNSGCFLPHILLHWCPISLASLVAIPCRLSAWPGKLEPFTGHPSTHGCQTCLWMSLDHWTSCNGIATHEPLAYCCICQIVVKRETWNRACIRPLLANLVTNEQTRVAKDENTNNNAFAIFILWIMQSIGIQS